jgi:putative AdoMet-dependent methyltransferase
MRLLDVGAGTGNLLSRLGSSGYELWAIEPSSGMREKLLEKCRDVHLLEGELPELPLFGMKFDCIVSSYAIHHVEHSKTRTMIESMCRNLGPGGLLLLADVMFESRPALEKHLADLEGLGMMDRIEEILDEPFQFVDELADCLTRLGKEAQVERFSFYSFCIMAK